MTDEKAPTGAATPPQPTAERLERLRHLAKIQAIGNHVRWKPGTKKFRESGHTEPSWECPHPDCVLVREPIASPTPTEGAPADNALAIACAELAGYRDGFEGLPSSPTFNTSDENLAYMLWFGKSRKVRTELIDKIDTLAALVKAGRSAAGAETPKGDKG